MFRLVFILLLTFQISYAGCRDNLRFAAGQMVMAGFRADSFDDKWLDSTKTLLRKGELSGVIFYGYNIKNPAQTKQLTKAFKDINGAEVPIFTAVDSEGGHVQRLTAEKGFQDFPSANKIFRTMPPYGAYSVYKNMAEMLKGAGFNTNFAPVADLNVNPESPAIGALGRSFSNDPAGVSLYAAQFVRAHRSENIITSLKHFPGHGSAKNDSHKGFTDVSDTWSASELAPFQMLINQGYADSVMTAHVFNRFIDDKYPASLSEKYINKLLRNEMGFDGVVFTDDLQMGAVTEFYGFEDTIYRAVKSGSDVLIFSNYFDPDEKTAERAVNTIVSLVDKGKIEKAEIIKSCSRVVSLKKERFSDEN